MKKQTLPQIFLVNYGSQFTPKIAKVLMAHGYRVIMMTPDKIKKHLKDGVPKGVILSGGYKSVYDEDAPPVPVELFEAEIPILGICFGMQIMCHYFDKQIVANHLGNKEYGEATVTLEKSVLFTGISATTVKVWANHGDSIQEVPKGFEIINRSAGNCNAVIQGIENTEKKYFGFQFHPEVTQTQHGDLILKNFVELVCGCEKDWDQSKAFDDIRQRLVTGVGNGKACILVSGGVDSMVTAKNAVLDLKPDQYECVFIDTGLMRKGEVEEVQRFALESNIPLTVINEKKRFFEILADETDPQKKRDIFASGYVDAIEDHIANQTGFTCVVQGTNQADKTESGHKGESAQIKRHHNIDIKFSVPIVEPLEFLYKHEIRELAEQLGLSKEISQRHPFPGPGMALRINGIGITEELVEIIQEADFITKNILIEEGWFGSDRISQPVVNLNGAKTTGNKGDGPIMGYAVVVRAVKTVDYLTAEGIEFPTEVRRRIKKAIPELLKPVVRVLFDETDKSPATIEWE